MDVLERNTVKKPALFKCCAVAFAATCANAASPYVTNELRAWGSGAGFLSQPAKAMSIKATSIIMNQDGTVISWGGAGTAPTTLSNILAISAGANFGLALKSDSTVTAWPADGTQWTTVPSALKSVSAIAAGNDFGVALKSNGTAVAWGNDYYGPVTIPRGLGVLKAIAAGSNHVLALKADSTVVGWGRNDYNQTTIPAGAEKGVGIAGGDLASLVLRADSVAIFWGGYGNVLDSLRGVSKGIPGDDHFLFILSDGKIVRWKKPQVSKDVALSVIDSSGEFIDIGNNGSDYGLKRDGSIVAFDGSYLPLPMDSVTVLSANSKDNGIPYALALRKDSTLHLAWTSNVNSSEYLTSALKALNFVVGFSCGNSGGVALKSDSTVVAFGGFTAPPSWLTGVKAVAAADDFSLALLSDSTIVGWGGMNSFGQRTTSAISGAIAIAAGTYHGVALLADSTVAAWGRNDHGESTVPAGLSGVVAIAAGNWHTLALKADGTVVAWGVNWDGECTVPAGLKNVVAISAGLNHSVALKSDGTVVAWGGNDKGQSTIPAGLTGVTAIAAGVNFTIAKVTKSNVTTEIHRFGRAVKSLGKGAYSVTVHALDGSVKWAGKALWNGSSWDMGFHRQGSWLVRIETPEGFRTQSLVLLK
jgi:alpha-tubulin suppressor-like RCC1 family protein